MTLHLTSFIGALAVSLFLTSKVLKFLLKNKITDQPNHRSLHSLATPRGGGIAIALTLTLAYLLFLTASSGSLLFYGFLLVASLILAFTGWLDDRNPLDARLRLLVQILVSLFIASNIFADNLLLLLLAALFLVYSINAFNFMDGIDGMASVQSLFVSITLLLFTYNKSPELSITTTLIAGASLGFLFFNWQPAKIFLGDVGSTFLGLILSALLLKAYSLGILTLPAILLLLGVFLVDTFYTLTVRFYQRKNVLKAHRDHTYQHAVLLGSSHRKVSFFVGLINFFYLFPLAVLTQQVPSYAYALLAIGYLPLFYCAYYYKAGNPNFQRTSSNKR